MSVYLLPRSLLDSELFSCQCHCISVQYIFLLFPFAHLSCRLHCACAWCSITAFFIPVDLPHSFIHSFIPFHSWLFFFFSFNNLFSPSVSPFICVSLFSLTRYPASQYQVCFRFLLCFNYLSGYILSFVSSVSRHRSYWLFPIAVFVSFQLPTVSFFLRLSKTYCLGVYLLMSFLTITIIMYSITPRHIQI